MTADKGREGRGKTEQRLIQFSLCFKFTHFRKLIKNNVAIRKESGFRVNITLSKLEINTTIFEDEMDGGRVERE